MKFSLVQILVVVANIQVEILKAEVEKGFMRTAIDHELVDPKIKINLLKLGNCSFVWVAMMVVRPSHCYSCGFTEAEFFITSKGNKVNIP